MMPSRSPKKLVVGLLLLGSLTTASAWAGYITLQDNGPSSNRVDAVFLGDGYQASETATYQSHIVSMMDYIFNAGQDPFPRYSSYFNAHRIDVVSNESGADDPNNGTYVDTALDASFAYQGGPDRLLYINEAKADQALANGVGGAFTPDMLLVTVNTTKYGGGGGKYGVWAGGDADANEVALHELGHSFGDLADEYGGGGNYTGAEPSEVNVTTDPSGAKWSQWIGYDQPVIGVIGAYEGGRYHDAGIYRPSENSKMRSLGNPFDAVSREELILDIYRLVDPLDAWLSALGELTNPDYLWVDVIDPLTIDTQWYVDGALVAGASGEQFDPRAFGYQPGTYEVTSKNVDNTPWVRRDFNLLRQEVSWTVTYSQVPEPGTLAIFALGFLGVAVSAWRRKT